MSSEVIEAWTNGCSDKEATTSKENNNYVAVTSSKNDEDYLFDPSLLSDIDLTTSQAEFNPKLSVTNPGDCLKLRPLQQGDYRRGFLQLLGQLTTVGEICEEKWNQRFNQMKRHSGIFHVMVLEDTLTKKVVGATTLVVEPKFIHECGQVGRVEDVVVCSEYRGRQLGKFLVAVSVLLAAKLDCYKVTLNCKDNMIKFYNGMGFKCEDGDANFMVIRI